MDTCAMSKRLRGLLTVVFVGLLLSSNGTRAQDKATPGKDQMPRKVMEGLMAKFPKAEIDKWTKEKEGETVVYDIEFTQSSQHFEADIKEDGTIHNWEKAIASKDLPASVVTTVNRKYPKATMKDVMQVTAVKNGKDVLEGYEIGLLTADRRDIEVTVAPDGEVLEDTGVKK